MYNDDSYLIFFPTVSNQRSCQACFENLDSKEGVALCNNKSNSVQCTRDTFPSIGITHCYKAEPRYKFLGSEDIRVGIVKGCINCTGKTTGHHWLFLNKCGNSLPILANFVVLSVLQMQQRLVQSWTPQSGLNLTWPYWIAISSVVAEIIVTTKP